METSSRFLVCIVETIPSHPSDDVIESTISLHRSLLSFYSMLSFCSSDHLIFYDRWNDLEVHSFPCRVSHRGSSAKMLDYENYTTLNIDDGQLLFDLEMFGMVF